MRPTTIFLVVVVVFSAGGCRDQDAEDAPGRLSAERFGTLPGLRETPHPELQAELARIVEEEGTPQQLARRDVAPEENAAAELARLFLPTRVAATFEQSGEIFPQGRFAFNPVRLQRAIEFLEKYRGQHKRAREALARPECHFGIRYQAGFEADLGFIDVVRCCARLEAFAAAEALDHDDPDAAAEAFAYMLRLAACLAAEKHVTCRLEGAFLRAEALAVLESLVEHPDVTRVHLERLCARLDEQLTDWTADAEAWIGDRALGMHAYELVRAGRLEDLLTPKEIAQFAEEGILKELPAAAQRTVNQDELYYLRTIRQIIDGCARPYYTRAELFEGIRLDLHEKRNSPEFPVVAARLLLVDIEKGQAIQAQDRAACEAWALALALASGGQQPDYRINPLSGEPYQVERQQGVITVWGVLPGDAAGDPTVLVPDLAKASLAE